MFHPWHHVSIGKEAPKTVNAVVEIPMGTRAKYELDKESGLLRLDRVLYSSFYYPANYGFIPQSYGKDRDPLDILILSQIQLVPLCVVEARVVGVMQMVDNREDDDKIIAVAIHDMSVNYIKDMDSLPPHFTTELRHFFEQYKTLEHKTVTVEDFQNREKAYQIIQESIHDYNKYCSVPK
ncbi:MAG TPA: inorganic diphosphatase [Chitinophagaceae bacterium]|nr:inorganic diphosphatase [Chitinophagaceae bacterium]